MKENKPIKQIKTGDSGDGIEFVNTEIKYSDLWKYNRWSDKDLFEAYSLGVGLMGGYATLSFGYFQKWLKEYKKQKNK